MKVGSFLCIICYDKSYILLYEILSLSANACFYSVEFFYAYRNLPSAGKLLS